MMGRGEQDGFCCEMMQGNVTNTCDQHPDRYDCPDMLIDRVRGGYGLMIRSDAGGGVIEIRYCPWCGSNLPPIGDIEIP